MAPAIGCGACYPCSRGFTNLCDNLQTIGFQFNGGFAEYMEVPAIAFDRGNVYRTPAACRTRKRRSPSPSPAW